MANDVKSGGFFNVNNVCVNHCNEGPPVNLGRSNISADSSYRIIPNMM